MKFQQRYRFERINLNLINRIKIVNEVFGTSLIQLETHKGYIAAKTASLHVNIYDKTGI